MDYVNIDKRKQHVNAELENRTLTNLNELLEILYNNKIVSTKEKMEVINNDFIAPKFIIAVKYGECL